VGSRPRTSFLAAAFFVNHEPQSCAMCEFFEAFERHGAIRTKLKVVAEAATKRKHDRIDQNHQRRPIRTIFDGLYFATSSRLSPISLFGSLTYIDFE
jgi:hypothetical protein